MIAHLNITKYEARGWIIFEIIRVEVYFGCSRNRRKKKSKRGRYPCPLSLDNITEF
jgi:hypothetical protein